MKKFLLYTLLLTCLAFSTIVAMPLSPESVSNLRASGHLEEVLERQNRARALGIDAPGSNVLEGIRQLHRDNPDEVTLRVLIILVDFEDNEANNDEFPAEHFEQLLFSVDEFEPGSMREWYLENTYDEVDLIGDVIGWVRLPETYAYYVNRNNGNGGWPQNSQRMTYDAVQLIEDEVDFSIYDNDDNGSVDGIFVVHAGPGAEQNDGNRDMIWSHAWGLNNHRLQYDGVWIDRYSTEPEDGQIGVFGHEAAHALFGIPDLYDRGYQSSGLGAWSMMAGGSWGDGGRSPAHFDAWSKLQMGVIDPQNVNENLYNIEIPAIESEDASYIIWQDGDPGNEYFLIENRQQIGFDTSIPGAG
ncbi:MAG: M6 family metalloprotease domain-containing protein, partial [Calditrichaeota bacterium]|nr:M6 family metalloprotease domain-containing protein [Calditrichota bacterium]